MKILNRKDFLSLPKGVLYSHYDERSQEFSELSIKDETTNNSDYGGMDDWAYLSLIHAPSSYLNNLFHQKKYKDIDAGQELIKNKNSFGVDYNKGYTRDGSYNEEEYFVVYEKEDFEKLVKMLNGMITEYPEINFDKNE